MGILYVMKHCYCEYYQIIKRDIDNAQPKKAGFCGIIERSIFIR